jgi:chorismate mutase
MSDINELRREIDLADRQLVELIQHRNEISLEIGRIKAAKGMPIVDPARESAHIKEAADYASTLNVDPDQITAVLRNIMDGSVAIQQSLQSASSDQ